MARIYLPALCGELPREGEGTSGPAQKLSEFKKFVFQSRRAFMELRAFMEHSCGTSQKCRRNVNESASPYPIIWCILNITATSIIIIIIIIAIIIITIISHVSK